MAKFISAILTAATLLISVNANTFAAEEHDPRVIAEVSDFSQIARRIERERLPLVLMFSSEYCAYCVRVENDFLIPMQISGDYEQRALIRKVKIDFGNTIRDFDGKTIDADQFAARYNVTVTPTVVFLDQHGQQLTAKRVGLMTPDFYGGYLDESIATALDLLRRTKPLRVSLD